jgi:hypothetical protein
MPWTEGVSFSLRMRSSSASSLTSAGRRTISDLMPTSAQARTLLRT